MTSRTLIAAAGILLASAALLLPSQASASVAQAATEPYCSTVKCENGSCSACGNFAMSWCDPFNGTPKCLASDAQF